MTKWFQLIVILILGAGLGFLGGYAYLSQMTEHTATVRKPLYYRHPMNPQVTSPAPAKDEMGMDYVAVYAEPQAESATTKTGKIIYYRHPMGAADTSLVPKKDEMGMDYLPVYEGELAEIGQLQITPEKIQKLGVTTAVVNPRQLIRNLRALGSIQVDERRVHSVTPKFEGWIQRLYVNTTGQIVKHGQPLLEIYSPDLIAAQQEYLVAKQGEIALKLSSPQAKNTAAKLSENALQRLHNWDIAQATLQRLQNSQKTQDTLPLLSPVDGVIVDKPAVEGMRFMPGELLFRIADLSQVWLIVDVFEQDIAEVALGQAVQVHINAYPDRQFAGKVAFIYPTLATETRTVKVRIELPNHDALLKPGLYGSVVLGLSEGKQPQLAVPASAVLDSGTRQIVLVQKNVGLFEPRTVKLGRQANGFYQVLQGLSAGDEVVTHANFLIDAESNLKSALSGMSPQDKDSNSLPIEDAEPDASSHY